MPVKKKRSVVKISVKVKQMIISQNLSQSQTDEKFKNKKNQKSCKKPIFWKLATKGKFDNFTKRSGKTTYKVSKNQASRHSSVLKNNFWTTFWGPLGPYQGLPQIWLDQVLPLCSAYDISQNQLSGPYRFWVIAWYRTFLSCVLLYVGLVLTSLPLTKCSKISVLFLKKNANFGCIFEKV